MVLEINKMKNNYESIKLTRGVKIGLAGLAFLVGGVLAWSVAEIGPKKTFEAFCNGAYSANVSNMVHYNPPYTLKDN